MTLVLEKFHKGRTTADAHKLGEELAEARGVDIYADEQTHYVLTSQSDEGLLVQLHQVDPIGGDSD